MKQLLIKSLLITVTINVSDKKRVKGTSDICDFTILVAIHADVPAKLHVKQSLAHIETLPSMSVLTLNLCIQLKGDKENCNLPHTHSTSTQTHTQTHTTLSSSHLS